MQLDLVGDNMYRGKRMLKRCYVTVNEQPLNPRYDLRNHSPDGFEWGYGGSGPSQLALAILAHEYGGVVALSYYQRFRDRVVVNLANDSWILTTKYINDVMAEIAEVDLGGHGDEQAG